MTPSRKRCAAPERGTQEVRPADAGMETQMVFNK
jgi:hypothetical protein